MILATFNVICKCFQHGPIKKVLFGKELNAVQVMIYILHGEENIVGKGEMLITSNFSFSHSIFKSLLLEHH